MGTDGQARLPITREAFGALFDAVAQDVFGYCLRRCGDPSRAEDLLSVVFLEAWRCRDKAINVDGCLRPWVFGIAANVVRSEARAQRRHRAALERYSRANPGLHEPDHSAAVVARVVSPATFRAVEQAIAALPNRERVIADLCLIEEMPVSTAATVLGIPLGTAKSRLGRARGRLRRLLQSGELLGLDDPSDHVKGARFNGVPVGRRS